MDAEFSVCPRSPIKPSLMTKGHPLGCDSHILLWFFQQPASCAAVSVGMDMRIAARASSCTRVPARQRLPFRKMTGLACRAGSQGQLLETC